MNDPLLRHSWCLLKAKSLCFCLILLLQRFPAVQVKVKAVCLFTSATEFNYCFIHSANP